MTHDIRTRRMVLNGSGDCQERPGSSAFFYLHSAVAMAADIRIRRIHVPGQVLGTLQVGSWSCWTLELPWRSNRLRESCIPPEPGHSPIKYEARKHESPQFGKTIYLPGVSDRSEILIHPGNYVSDTAGCILVGDDLRDINGNGALDVTRSQATMQKVLDLMPDDMTVSVGWHDKPKAAEMVDETNLDWDEVRLQNA